MDIFNGICFVVSIFHTNNKHKVEIIMKQKKKRGLIKALMKELELPHDGYVDTTGHVWNVRRAMDKLSNRELESLLTLLGRKQ